MLLENLAAQYRILKDDSGFVPVAQTVFSLSGNDRASFLHNFCTADVKGLQPGQNTEAFILNGKGKILGHVHLLATESEIIVVTVPGQFGAIFEHLDKYVIREDAKFSDLTDTSTCFFARGGSVSTLLSKGLDELPATNQNWDGRETPFGFLAAAIERAGEGYLFVCSVHDADRVRNWLIELGVGECDPHALEIVRIESGTPLYAKDMDESNLPQELRRDDKTISFEKGCYLGQETVARIDALGHVNQFLVPLVFEAEVSPEDEILVADKVQGKVTSVAWSPTHSGWVGLGYLKRAYCKTGTEFQVGQSKGTVGVL